MMIMNIMKKITEKPNVDMKLKKKEKKLFKKIKQNEIVSKLNLHCVLFTSSTFQQAAAMTSFSSSLCCSSINDKSSTNNDSH
jgi:hypothetical protein